MTILAVMVDNSAFSPLAEGYNIPLSYHAGLPYMDLRPPTDAELHSLTHIILTSDAVWDPSCLDDESTFEEIAHDAPPLTLPSLIPILVSMPLAGTLSASMKILM